MCRESLKVDLKLKMVTAKKEKQVPDIELKEDALQDLCFVFSGEFEHFTRESAKSFVQDRSGLFRTAISKKTSYLVAGLKIGQKKLDDAKEKGVQVIDESAFIELVQTRTSVPAKRKSDLPEEPRKKQKEDQENEEDQEEDVEDAQEDVQDAAVAVGAE